MSEEKQRHFPHSSYRVWQRVNNRDYFKILPGLKVKKKGDMIVAVGLIAAGVVLGASMSVQIYGYSHQPTQLFGVCPAPAFLKGGSCLETFNVIQNGVSVKNVTEACGPPLCYYMYVENGTVYKP